MTVELFARLDDYPKHALGQWYGNKLRQVHYRLLLRVRNAGLEFLGTLTDEEIDKNKEVVGHLATRAQLFEYPLELISLMPGIIKTKIDTLEAACFDRIFFESDIKHVSDEVHDRYVTPYLEFAEKDIGFAHSVKDIIVDAKRKGNKNYFIDEVWKSLFWNADGYINHEEGRDRAESEMLGHLELGPNITNPQRLIEQFNSEVSVPMRRVYQQMFKSL